ncbi:hypothetical protein N8500_07110 [Candidatus Puniceispirillum sp.]|nr:hypothetical protein [Candidatus Puniceispirillum sp.]
MFRSIAVEEKKLYINAMKQLFLSALIGYVVLFSGCVSKSDVVTCPKISAPEEGAQAFVRAGEIMQSFVVRLNGVTAECRSHKSGGTEVALMVGLKLSRNLVDGKEQAFLSVPMMTATVNELGTVIANDEFGYRVGFDRNDDQKYPTVEIEKLIPANARLVISLKPSF